MPAERDANWTRSSVPACTTAATSPRWSASFGRWRARFSSSREGLRVRIGSIADFGRADGAADRDFAAGSSAKEISRHIACSHCLSRPAVLASLKTSDTERAS